MVKRILLLIPLIIQGLCCNAQSDTVRVYIQVGNATMVDGIEIKTKSFTTSTSYNFQNQVIFFKSNQPTVLRIINEDVIDHTLQFGPSYNFTVSSLTILDTSVIFLTSGILAIHDVNKVERYLGLESILSCASSTTLSYFWNLKEIQSTFNEQLFDNQLVSFDSFRPNYFLINGYSNPALANDTLSKIRGRVGDTLRLYIHNAGNSVHSLHFHGYHFTVESSSIKPESVGWIKDTYAVLPKESLSLIIVPDKPGEYPVHDHNLVAVSANSFYPNGMFTTIVITE
ncbi:MAG: hypothetical protein ACI8ZN_001239 [Bacteroidia bacterium]|jgi:hypothetical protein